MATISWSTPLKIDGQYAFLKTINPEIGQYIETDTSMPEYEQIMFKGPAIFHPEYKILYRSPSDYIGARGKFLLMNQWKSENDTDVEYLEQNFANSPYPLKSILTDVEFDWSERIFYRTIDTTLRQSDIWIDANMDWSFCLGSLARYEFVSNDCKLVGITNKDLFMWQNRTIRLETLESIEYVKPENVDIAYIIVIEGSVRINGVEYSEDFVAHIVSPILTIEKVDSPVILIREKHVTI